MDGRLVADSMQAVVPDFKVAHQFESSASVVLLPPINNSTTQSAKTPALEQLVKLAQERFILPLLSQPNDQAWFSFFENNIYAWHSLLGTLGTLASREYGGCAPASHVEQARGSIEQGALNLGGEPALEQLRALQSMETSANRLVLRLCESSREDDTTDRKLATQWLATTNVCVWMDLLMIEASMRPECIVDDTRDLPMAMRAACVAKGREAARKAADLRGWKLEREEWFDAITEIINTNVMDLPLLFEMSPDQSLDTLPLA